MLPSLRFPWETLPHLSNKLPWRLRDDAFWASHWPSSLITQACLQITPQPLEKQCSSACNQGIIFVRTSSCNKISLIQHPNCITCPPIMSKIVSALGKMAIFLLSNRTNVAFALLQILLPSFFGDKTLSCPHQKKFFFCFVFFFGPSACYPLLDKNWLLEPSLGRWTLLPLALNAFIRERFVTILTSLQEEE